MDLPCDKSLSKLGVLLKNLLLVSRVWLFETNDIVSLHEVKISNVTISNLPIFFVEKNVRSLKASLIFSVKNITGLVLKW